MGVRFPFEDVCRTIGTNYFATNSLAYMIALAIHEHFDEIKLYGFSMDATDWSDNYARPCIEYMLGLAVGRGIKVWVARPSALLLGDLYAKTVPVPSFTLEMAADALRTASASLAQTAAAMEGLYQLAVKGQAQHGEL